jgi:SAM-dependent methyltransferase
MNSRMAQKEAGIDDACVGRGMLEMGAPILADAEKAAKNGPLSALRELRKLGLDDFSLFLIGLPSDQFPALSSVLPRMASDEIQRHYTGTSDVTLLRQTLAFVWMLRAKFNLLTGRPLEGCRVLDFGCGYGRIIRAMYYLTDPDNIFAVDAWQRPLDMCRDCGMLGNFIKCDEGPSHIDVSDQTIDLIYSFSVFTHLSRVAMIDSFAALRKAIRPDGLFIATVRPIETWKFRDERFKKSDSEAMIAAHRKDGFAFSGQTKNYGDASVSLDMLSTIPGWKILSHDRSLLDPHQIAIAFQPIYA